jgi:uncharacterized membrane protein YidH (DUF202 family)
MCRWPTGTPNARDSPTSAALTAAGLLAFVYGVVRYRELDAALREGREPERRDSALLVLAGIGVAAGVASILLVLFAP